VSYPNKKRGLWGKGVFAGGKKKRFRKTTAYSNWSVSTEEEGNCKDKKKKFECCISMVSACPA